MVHFFFHYSIFFHRTSSLSAAKQVSDETADKQKAVPEKAFFAPHQDCFLLYIDHTGTQKVINLLFSPFS